MRVENGFPSIGLLSASEKLTPEEAVAAGAGLKITAAAADAQTLNSNECLAPRKSGIDLAPTNLPLAGLPQISSSFALKNGFDNHLSRCNEHTITLSNRLSQAYGLTGCKIFIKRARLIRISFVNRANAAPQTLGLNN